MRQHTYPIICIVSSLPLHFKWLDTIHMSYNVPKSPKNRAFRQVVRILYTEQPSIAEMYDSIHKLSKKEDADGAATRRLQDCNRIDRLCRSGGEFSVIGLHLAQGQAQASQSDCKQSHLFVAFYATSGAKCNFRESFSIEKCAPSMAKSLKENRHSMRPSARYSASM